MRAGRSLANTHADANCNTNSDGNAYSNGHSDRDSNGNTNTDGHPKTYTDTKIPAGTKAPPDAAAASVVCRANWNRYGGNSRERLALRPESPIPIR